MWRTDFAVAQGNCRHYFPISTLYVNTLVKMESRNQLFCFKQCFIDVTLMPVNVIYPEKGMKTAAELQFSTYEGVRIFALNKKNETPLFATVFVVLSTLHYYMFRPT
jgi:hypothetical protein